MADPETAVEMLAQMHARAEEASRFRNPRQLLDLIEHAYRAAAPGLIRNPRHMCLPVNCRALPVDVCVYRLPRTAQRFGAGGGGGGPSTDMVVRTPLATDAEEDEDVDPEDRALAALAAPFMDENVHICLPQFCEHLPDGPRGHRGRQCPLGPGCPHAVPPAPGDSWNFRDLYACSITGNIHACGALCHARHTLLQSAGQHMCPVTGVDLGAHLALQTVGRPYMRNTGGSVDDPSAAPASAAARRAYPQQFAAAMRREALADARKAYTLLVESHERRRRELQNALKEYRAAVDAITRMLKRKMQRPNMQYPAMARALWTLAQKPPDVAYFAEFGIAPDIRAAAADGIRTFALTTHPPMATASSARARAARATNNALILTLLTEGDLRPPLDPHEVSLRPPLDPHEGSLRPPLDPPLRPPAGPHTLAVSGGEGGRGGAAGPPSHGEMVAQIAVRVYENLRRYQDLYAQQVPSFRSMVLPLFYRMRTGYYVPMHSGSGEIHNVHYIMVIPQVPIMALMPKETAAATFHGIETCATLSRALVINNQIMQMFQLIAAAGHLLDVKLEITDFITPS